AQGRSRADLSAQPRAGEAAESRAAGHPRPLRAGRPGRCAGGLLAGQPAGYQLYGSAGRPRRLLPQRRAGADPPGRRDRRALLPLLAGLATGLTWYLVWLAAAGVICLPPLVVFEVGRALLWDPWDARARQASLRRLANVGRGRPGLAAR